MAELVWKEGTLIKDYPPEAYRMKNLDDVWEYLKTDHAVPKFEAYIRSWMKQIQELLLESEQLRLETDDAGPQVLVFGLAWHNIFGNCYYRPLARKDFAMFIFLAS